MGLWLANIRVTDCATGDPIAGAGVADPVAAGIVTDDQGVAQFWIDTDIAVIGVTVTREGYNLVADVPVVQSADVVAICLNRAPTPVTAPTPSSLHVATWSDTEVTLRWSNPREYDKVQVRWRLQASATPSSRPSTGTSPRRRSTRRSDTESNIGSRCKAATSRLSQGWCGGTTRGSTGSCLLPNHPGRSTSRGDGCGQCRRAWRIALIPGECAGAAAAGGWSSIKYHTDGGSGRYRIRTSPAPGYQDGWRICSTCKCLVHGNGGVCSVGVGFMGHAGHATVHNTAGSYHFYLKYQGPGSLDEHFGWRFCTRCRGLVQTPDPNGYCYDGGRHDFAGSLPYDE